MKLPKELTRKVGPLPVYGWALLAVVAGYLYLRHTSSASSLNATGVPVSASPSGLASGALGAATSSPADQGGSDLASALDTTTSAYEALLSALQSAAVSSSGGTAPATDTTTTTAPTFDSGTANAPVMAAPAVTQANAYDPAQAASAAALGVSAQPNMTLDQLNEQLVAQGREPVSYPSVIQPAPSPAMIGGPSQVAPPVPFGTSAPTIVQPAPVDTTSVTVAAPAATADVGYQQTRAGKAVAA